MCLLNFYTTQILISTFCIIECISLLIEVTNFNDKFKVNTFSAIGFDTTGQTDRQTDRRTDTTKSKSAIRAFTNAPKKIQINSDHNATGFIIHQALYATWCFQNNGFDVADFSKKFVDFSSTNTCRSSIIYKLTSAIDIRIQTYYRILIEIPLTVRRLNTMKERQIRLPTTRSFCALCANNS